MGLRRMPGEVQVAKVVILGLNMHSGYWFKSKIRLNYTMIIIDHGRM